MAFVYRTIPCPPVVRVNNAKQDEQVVRQYAEWINREATDGWEFYSMENITVEEPSGCLTFWKGNRQTTYNMMVFRKEV